MSATAIILARAGSKGVPGKNGRSIAGKPCIGWTIEHAQRSERVSRVCVSTDGGALADIAAGAGVETVERPASLATDTATIDDAARHAVLELERAAGRPIAGPIVILYANVPVRPADLTDRAVAMLCEQGCDSVQSYCPVGKHHPWWTARIDSRTGAATAWEGDTLNHGVFRRQDLPAAHIPDGGVIALTRAALMLGIEGVPPGPHAFLGRDRRGIITAEGEVIDIDTEVDLLVAEAMLRGARGRTAAQTPAGATR